LSKAQSGTYRVVEVVERLKPLVMGTDDPILLLREDFLVLFGATQLLLHNASNDGVGLDEVEMMIEGSEDEDETPEDE